MNLLMTPRQDAIDAAAIGITIDEVFALDASQRAVIRAWATLPENRKRTDRACAQKVGLPISAWVTLPWQGKDQLLRDAKQRWAIAHPAEYKRPRTPRAKLPADEALARQRASKAKSQRRHPEAHRRAVAAYKRKTRLER
jgi:hypothetical protein